MHQAFVPSPRKRESQPFRDHAGRLRKGCYVLNNVQVQAMFCAPIGYLSVQGRM